MEKLHVLVIPYPAQGHVIPLMEVTQCLASRGIKATFVNTEVTHKLVMNAWSGEDSFNNLIHMVSIPDGMEPWEDRSDLAKLSGLMSQVMPGKLEELIENITNKGYEKITCIIADGCMGWAIRVAKKMGIRRSVFWPASAALLAVILSIQKLIDDGIINNSGDPLKHQMFQLSPTIPSMEPANFAWVGIGDSATKKIFFENTILDANEAAKMAECIVCNSTIELETGALALFPNTLPIGPLLATNRCAKQAGHFWKEDSTCLTWLDQQPACSVIYVAFGSFTIFDQAQFKELALGLELTNKPFLWVVRPGMVGSANMYPNGYIDRVSDRGLMVSWAPQQKVLNHPSVACFMSHCGWNSTLEGVSNGVPFLCWPYFADQFLNATYICDVWRNGLGLNKDEAGIITQGEIKNKVEKLLSDIAFKENALSLQEKAVGSVREGGSSNKNFNNFIDWIKERNRNAESHSEERI